MPIKRLVLLSVILLCAVVAYMSIGIKGNIEFVMAFRGQKLFALFIVAIAISTSTLLFQTLANNRIITPSIMGFDALYVLIITMSVFFFGGSSFFGMGKVPMFLLNTAILLVASNLLFGSLLFDSSRDISRMILTGIILATMFRALSDLAVRMIDPNEFAHIQISSFARFSQFDADLLTLSAVVVALCLVFVWRLRHRLDVLSLGPDIATGLGQDVKFLQIVVLVIVAILVSVSTALVGPVVFLGLLVVAIAHQITPSVFHGILLTSSALIAAITLVGGQTILERIFGLSTPLSVIIDVFGGLLFLFILFERIKRDSH